MENQFYIRCFVPRSWLTVVSEHLLVDGEMLSLVQGTKLHINDKSPSVSWKICLFFIFFQRRLKGNVAVESTPSKYPVISLIYVRPNALKLGTARDISARGRYNYYGCSGSLGISLKHKWTLLICYCNAVGLHIQ